MSKRTNQNGLSHKSGRSFASRYSRRNTNPSVRQRRQKLEEEAAILKVKMHPAYAREEVERLGQNGRMDQSVH